MKGIESFLSSLELLSLSLQQMQCKMFKEHPAPQSGCPLGILQFVAKSSPSVHSILPPHSTVILLYLSPLGVDGGKEEEGGRKEGRERQWRGGRREKWGRRKEGASCVGCFAVACTLNASYNLMYLSLQCAVIWPNSKNLMKVMWQHEAILNFNLLIAN